jgi:alpha-glucosidase
MDVELLDTHSGPRHPIWDRDEVHEVYRGWRRVLDEYDGERAFVAEAWVTDPERLAMYVRPDELHTAFNFQYLRAPWEAAALRSTIDECLATTHAVGAPTTWVLSNHDVTRHATRYGRLDHTGGGVAEGERVRPDTPLDLSLGRKRARAATLLTLALPGSTYLYQGEELGLEEVVDLPESVLQDPIWERTHHAERGRDGCRVPIPWTPDGPSLGFGSGEPWLPQPADWAQRSVAVQQGAEGSTLELYRAALALRRAEPAFGEGDMSWQPSPDDTLLFERSDAASGSRVVCAVNLGESAVPLPSYGKVLLASGPLGPQAELPPDTTVWLRV